MKKTLIASAIAATLASNAMAADVTSEAADLAAKLDSMPTIYGAVQFAHVSTDNDNITTNELEDNGSTIGIKHEHAISEGITAFAKAEFEFGADDKRTSNGINKIDEAYIGLKGDFGSVQVGSDETVYDWVDMTDIDEIVGFGATVKLDEGDNLQYVSPLIAEGLTLGLTAPIDSDTNFGGALAAKYTMDNLQVALAYALGRDAEAGFAKAEDTLGLGVHFDIDELTLVAQYGTTKDTQDTWGLLGVYAMGQNSFALGYQMTSFDASALEDQTDIYIQAMHNLSDNAYLYLEYLMQTDIAGTANRDLDTLAIGAAYLF